jgi:hypothetical protein
MTKSKTDSEILNGWSEIAKFLKQPFSVAERWEKIRHASQACRPIRHCIAGEVNRWLGQESVGEPVHISTEIGGLSG